MKKSSDFEVFSTVFIGLPQGSIIGPFLLICIEDDLELLKGTYQVQKLFYVQSQRNDYLFCGYHLVYFIPFYVS